MFARAVEKDVVSQTSDASLREKKASFSSPSALLFFEASRAPSKTTSAFLASATRSSDALENFNGSSAADTPLPASDAPDASDGFKELVKFTYELETEDKTIDYLVMGKAYAYFLIKYL